MNHVIYYIGGPWDQHKVMRAEAPKDWEEVAELPPLTMVEVMTPSDLKLLRHQYRIDKVGSTNEATVYMARHEEILRRGY